MNDSSDAGYDAEKHARPGAQTDPPVRVVACDRFRHGGPVGLMRQAAHFPSAMRIQLDDPARPDVLALLEEHLRNMHELSPPESIHALDVGRLKSRDVSFWTVRDGEVLLGCGALKELDSTHGEVKSMRTPASLRRRGAGRAVLTHIVQEARSRGYRRLSLETGSIDAFAPAQRLYESFGFVYCGPFSDYEPDPNSVFMALALEDRPA